MFITLDKHFICYSDDNEIYLVLIMAVSRVTNISSYLFINKVMKISGKSNLKVVFFQKPR